MIQTKDISGQFKDVDSKKGIVCGYLNSFGILDSDGDIIQKGAFTKTLQENGVEGKKRIKYCLDHDTRKVVGVFQVLKEDDYGLYYEAQVGSHSLGQDYLKMVEEKIVTEHSIGFRTITEMKVNDNNVITEIKLFEGSGLQFWGANMYTPVTAVKSEADLELMLASLEKTLKSGTFSDETFQKIIHPKMESLKAILGKNTKPSIDTLPNAEEIKRALTDGFGFGFLIKN